MQKSNRTVIFRFIMLTAIAAAGFLASLTAWSEFPLGLNDVLQLVFSFDPDQIGQQLILHLRLPRALTAMILGGNLALAGLLMQGLTRNPLASPSLLGVNAGAACFVALSAVGLLFRLPPVLTAFAGAALGGAMALLLGGYLSSKPVHPVRLVLAGIAVNALLTGLTRASLIVAEDQAYSVLYWLAGSVAEAGWKQIPRAAAMSIPAVVLTWWLAPQLNTLSLGDDTAKSLGIHVIRIRWICSVLVLLFAAVSVAAAGPVSFVGLLIPHIARSVAGNDHKKLVPCCLLCGAALLLWSDVLSRGIGFPAETPVGIVTALLGTPFFIYLTCRRKT